MATQNNPNRAVIETQDTSHQYDMPASRKLGIYAEPVNQYITPAKTESQSLAEALNMAAPLIHSALQGGYEEANAQEKLQGAVASMQDGTQENPSTQASAPQSKGFFEGYMKMQGELASQKDADQLQTEWSQAPKADDNGIPVTFDSFANQWWKQKGEGIQDKSFLQGYAPGMDRALGTMKLKASDEAFKNLNADTDASIKALIKSDVQGYGVQYTPDNWLTRRQDFIDLGMPRNPDQLNKLMVDSLKELADAGTHPAEVNKTIQAIKSMEFPGGVPAMQKFSDTLDQIGNHAVSVALSKHHNFDSLAKQERKTAREGELSSILKTIYVDGNTEEGKAAFKALLADPRKLFDSEDIIKWSGSVDRIATRVDTEDQQNASLEMMPDAYQGKLSPESVLKAAHAGSIGRSGVKELMGIINQVNTQNRSLAASEARQEKAIFSSPQFKSAATLISSIPTHDPMDFDSTKSRTLRNQRALANNALHDFALNGGKPEQLFEYAAKLKGNIDNLLDAEKQKGADISPFISPSFRFDPVTLESVKSGKEQNLETVKAYNQYLKSLVPKPKEIKK